VALALGRRSRRRRHPVPPARPESAGSASPPPEPPAPTHHPNPSQPHRRTPPSEGNSSDPWVRTKPDDPELLHVEVSGAGGAEGDSDGPRDEGREYVEQQQDALKKMEAGRAEFCNPSRSRPGSPNSSVSHEVPRGTQTGRTRSQARRAYRAERLRRMAAKAPPSRGSPRRRSPVTPLRDGPGGQVRMSAPVDEKGVFLARGGRWWLWR